MLALTLSTSTLAPVNSPMTSELSICPQFKRKLLPNRNSPFYLFFFILICRQLTFIYRIKDTVGNSTLYFSFCNPIIDDSLMNCNGTASSCLDDLIEDEDLNLGDASTTKLEWRTSSQFKDKQLALVVESKADKTRTVAFLVCSEGVANDVVFLASDQNIPGDDDFDTYVNFLFVILLFSCLNSMSLS